MSIEPSHLNIDSWLGNVITILLLVLSSLLVLSIIFVVPIFFQVILWKLYAVHYLVLKAFKCNSCAFMSNNIKFPNQVIKFLMLYQSFLTCQSLSFAFLVPS